MVMEHDALAPLVLVAYTVEVPEVTPVTVIVFPVVELKLTFELLLLQVIVDESLEVAVNSIELPVVIEADDLFIVTVVVFPDEPPSAGYVVLALAKTLDEHWVPKIFQAYSG